LAEIAIIFDSLVSNRIKNHENLLGQGNPDDRTASSLDGQYGLTLLSLVYELMFQKLNRAMSG